MTTNTPGPAELVAHRAGIRTSTTTTVGDLSASKPEFRVVDDPAWRIVDSRLLVVRPPSLILMNPLTQAGWDATAANVIYDCGFDVVTDRVGGTPPRGRSCELRVTAQSADLLLGKIVVRVNHERPEWATQVLSAEEVTVVYAPSMPDGDVDLAWLDDAATVGSVRWASVPVVPAG